MTSLDRAFVAVVPPAAVLDAVAGALEPVRAEVVGARWAARERWHCTLRFLGPVPDVDAVVAALATVDDLPRFSVRVGGAGAFPSARRATVLWAGVTDGVDELTGLAGVVDRAVVRAGLPPAPRPFRPHVTLARLRHAVDVRRAVAELGESLAALAASATTWPVADVVVFESRGGYEEVARLALADPADGLPAQQ